MPVQPTSAGIGEKAVEVKATTEVEATSCDTATDTRTGGPGEVVPADADALDASDADASGSNGSAPTGVPDAALATGQAKAAKPQGKEPPTNEFPAIRLIGSWARMTGEEDADGPHVPGRNGATKGLATSNVRLTTTATAAPPAPRSASAQPESADQQPARAKAPAKAATPAKVPVTADHAPDADKLAAAALTVTIEPAATADATAASQTIVQAEPAAPDKASSSRAIPPQKPAAAAGEAPAAGQAGWRAPGLDGVRALAVLAVLAFHEGLPWIQGGFLGVDVFFVLSGYLITDLLVARYRKDGHIGLGRFYQRRARRLLPALALMLITVTAAVSLLEPSQRSALRPALLGAVTYTSNWWQALAHQSYFSLYGPPPVFQHLWSLAVEEQFYLIWPLLLAVILTLVHRPVTRALFAWAGAVAAALLTLALYTPGSDPSLAYYGTDTHASALMIGAALAITWPLAKIAVTTGRVRQVLDVLGAAGLVILAWSVWHLSGPDPFVYPYGLVLAAVAAGGLILAAAAPGRIGRLLSWRSLRWLGVRSYGIYLGTGR